MLVRFASAATLSGGETIKPGEFREVPDAEAYPLIHTGKAVPPFRVRLRSDGLIGSTHVAGGTTVDYPGPEPFHGWPGPPPDNDKFDARSAIVPKESGSTYGGKINHAWTADVPILLPAELARRLVVVGARFATEAEAAPLYAAA